MCEICLSNFISYTSYIVARDTKTPLKEIRNAPIDIDAEGISHQCFFFFFGYLNVNVSNLLCYVFSEVVLETKSPQKEFDVASQRFKILRKKVGTELLDIDASDTDHQCPMEFSVEDGTVRVETPGLDTLLLSSSSNSEVNAYANSVIFLILLS